MNKARFSVSLAVSLSILRGSLRSNVRGLMLVVDTGTGSWKPSRSCSSEVHEMQPAANARIKASCMVMALMSEQCSRPAIVTAFAVTKVLNYPAGERSGSSLECGDTSPLSQSADMWGLLRITYLKTESPHLVGRATPVLSLSKRPGAARMLVPVMSVAVHVPCLAVIVQINLQSLFDHALLELPVQQRKTYLDAAEEIPVHPVRTGEINVMLQIVAEIEDAGVFEKTADHRAHPDVLR